MNRCYLNEDKRLEKLLVVFSEDIIEKIDDINWCNRSNTEKLAEWHDYIDGITGYIANPVIAKDYMGWFQRYPNGTIWINEQGMDVTFMVKMKNGTNQQYVYVFDINLKPEDFGLKNPSMMYEGKHPYRESVRKVISLVERMEKL